MASPVGKEQQGNADTDSSSTQPRGPQTPGQGEGIGVKTAGNAAAGGDATGAATPQGEGRQALVPTQGTGGPLGYLDFDIDEEFELPSVLRPDPNAPPRRTGPRVTLSQLSSLAPVRQRRDRYVPPALAAVPPPAAAERAPAEPAAVSPSPASTPPLSVPQVQDLMSVVTPLRPSMKPALAKPVDRVPAAPDAPEVVPGPFSSAPAQPALAQQTPALQAPVQPVQTPVPPPVAPVASLPVPAPPAAVGAPELPPAASPQAPSYSMPFLDTRMRRMADFASKPEQVAPAPLASPPPATGFIAAPATPPVPAFGATTGDANAVPPRAESFPAYAPDAPPVPAPLPAVSTPAPPPAAFEIDVFSALPAFNSSGALDPTALPPPLPASLPQSLPMDPTALEAHFSADALTTDILGGADNAAADLLRPLLRDWLSDNMPRIIEKALRIEVAKSTPSPDDTSHE